MKDIKIPLEMKKKDWLNVEKKLQKEKKKHFKIIKPYITFLIVLFAA